MNRQRGLREARGLKREELAVQADISFSYVQRLESDDPPNPTLAVARRIADVLGVSVDDVFPVEPERTASAAPAAEVA